MYVLPITTVLGPSARPPIKYIQNNAKSHEIYTKYITNKLEIISKQQIEHNSKTTNKIKAEQNNKIKIIAVQRLGCPRLAENNCKIYLLKYLTI